MLFIAETKGDHHTDTIAAKLPCNFMSVQVNMLRERNKSYGAIKFVDISSKDYSPDDNQGLDYETVMGKIHAILSDGTVITDVEAFRKLYEEVGLDWVYAVRLSPATSSIYILYIRPLQSSLKDSISYIYFLFNNVL
ncbi:uncharacterized protein At5g50100, chloroplastic isoform X3 [Zea mays]|uniref:uncharacterized protein At5g50100, chloroplastic isoform X3 n=1 Tax=Zea mays TaxID=4577 RepID=UPI0016525D02|nr:uncharacterized protein At5g50100, chloroplastic isoform X3 [Zea mays]